jgi:hypothetical protein
LFQHLLQLLARNFLHSLANILTANAQELVAMLRYRGPEMPVCSHRCQGGDHVCKNARKSQR